MDFLFSGFGRLSAERLSAIGCPVVAACLTDQGVAELQGLVAVAIRCDVTKDADVERLANAVAAYLQERKKEGVRLWAVVNNAGVAPSGYLDWVSMDTVRKSMDVNYYGTVRVTQAFLPLLKTTRNSRIVNVSSAAGLSGFPHGGAYCGNNLVLATSNCFTFVRYLR